ncbi:MAG TPA: Calx-beta domain-containing protein, partial [Dokdonella sp.]
MISIDLPGSPCARAVRRRVHLRAFACHRLLSALLLAAFAASAQAQVALTALDTPYAQNFNVLPASGSAQWSNNATIPGWYLARTGTGTTIVADNGASNAGNLYSYGATGDSDRALGTIGSGGAAAGSFFYGVRLQNDTGATITSLDVSYTGEQWRNSAATAQTAAFSYLIGSPAVSGSLAEFQSAGVAVTALDFTSPVTGGTAGALNGNLPANQQARSFTIAGLDIPNGTEVMLRWFDPDNTGSDHGLAIDDVSLTPHGTGGAIGLSIADVSKNEGDAGTTTFTFTVSLPGPAPAGGVSFDIATADGSAVAPADYASRSLTAQTIPAGSSTYTFDVVVNGDTTAEPNEVFSVVVGNVSGAGVVRGTAIGTIVNDDFQSLKIHDVQGSGDATPIPAGTVVSVEGVVTADFQGADKLSGFFLQEEDTDADADPATSEGIFVYCGACPTAVAEGQRVRVSGTVTEYFGMTEINATTASNVSVTEAGNHLADVTPTPIELPVSGDVDAFYEAREGMLVTYADTLLVSEYFEQARYGQIELYPNERPRQFTEFQSPSVAGYAAYLDTLARSRVILDDENDAENGSLTLPEGQQYLYYPRASGGLSVGTQGVDFFRGGDEVHNLTGVLHWSFSGVSGTDAWRVRPVQASPATFTVANPRPTAAPAVGGAIKAAGMNLLNYFTTIDTTSSSSSGPCGPGGGQDCRGADSVAELNRQRERASIVLCTLDPDVAGLMELENTSASATITDLLGAVNARCGGTHAYTFVSTGGTLGTDAIRVALIYRAGIVAPVGQV